MVYVCKLTKRLLGPAPWNPVRVVILNAALGPLDYRAPKGAVVEPGAIVLAPLGPRQVTGVVWEPNRLDAGEVEATRLRPLIHVYDIPPVAEIGRAPCRARVCQYGWIPEVAESLKKKKK